MVNNIKKLTNEKNIGKINSMIKYHEFIVSEFDGFQTGAIKKQVDKSILYLGLLKDLKNKIK